jgi:predicted nucleic acid-binding protein
MTTLLVRASIDTDVPAAWAHGHAPATYFFLALIKIAPPLVSRVSALEVLRRTQSDAERRIALGLLRHMTLLDPTATIAQRAFALLAAVPLPTSLSASDAIVAATAIEHSLPLYTLDPPRFAAVPGLAAAKPY